MADFTRQEFDLLFDAIEALEGKAAASSMSTMLMGSMFCRTREQAEEFASTMKAEAEKEKAAGRALRERCILLKAKLIQSRDGMDADDLLTASRTDGGGKLPDSGP